ncbi:MAG: acylphosphatase [Desulfatitalea sp.]|nr:acylphosphatase [Desulfatitalea sp.]NNK00344.1 acylphosphatase [Desulfatitalea sp.]
MTTDHVKAHAIISGRVQGVFFRVETQRAADKIGVNGWVRNLPDRTVEAVFEGPRDRVETALAWCRKGSPLSQVHDVQVQWVPSTGDTDGFSVRY